MYASNAPLGAMLKSHRTRLGLTLEALSERSGVSRGMISKIERDEARPTTNVLGKLAEALDVSISQLMGGEKSCGVVRIEAARQPVFREDETGFERRSLSPLYGGRGVDFVLNTLPPHARTGPFPSHRPGVEEHLYVARGALEVTVGEETHALSAGDFLFYPADAEHVFSNPGEEPCAFFIVIDSTRLR